MTTFKGVAAVTQTLAHLADAVVRSAVQEARVTLDRPEAPPATARGEPRLNIYLIQVEFEPTMRSSDLPTRTSQGALVTVPQVALNLRYLFSYFGPPIKTHLMLGAIEVALRENAELDPALIREATQPHPDLRDSGLDVQTPPVRIVPSSASLEELSRFWSGFFQMPYTLSTMHQASAVILSSPLLPTATLPVHVAPAPAVSAEPPSDPDTPPSAGGHADQLVIRSITFDRDVRDDPVVSLSVAPAVQPRHEITLSLVAMDASRTSRATSVRVAATPAVAQDTFSLHPPELPPGRYLAVAEVDGVQSLPLYEHGRYAGPWVEVW